MAVIPSYTKNAIAAIALVVATGTAYSLKNNTYLDTSNPLLAHLPHPSHHLSYFANKRNVFNQVFVKKAWGWTTLAFWMLYAAAPPKARTADGIIGWVASTGVWILFTGWFFGPSLFSRVVTSSGGECVIHLPHERGSDQSHVIAVPAKYCLTRNVVSPATHAELFTDPMMASAFATQTIDKSWTTIPRLYRGHDVSGHTFLLTLSVLLLTHNIIRTNRLARRNARVVSGWFGIAVLLNWLLVGLWMIMIGTTAVYFHSPQEKVSGFVMGVLGYLITRIPALMSNSNTAATPVGPRRANPS